MILALLRLMRLYYSLPLASGFIVILHYLAGGSVALFADKAAVAVLSLACIISASYVFNDVCDIEVDKINCPHRMLAAGRIRREIALTWSMVLFGAGMTLAIYCGLAFFLGISAIAALLICYDMLSKRIRVFKVVLVAVLVTSLYPLSFALAEPVATPRLYVLFIHPVWLFFTAIGYEMLKDIRDIIGDSQVSGIDRDRRKEERYVTIARIFIVTASLITLLPYVLGYCRHIYLLASLAAIALAIASTFHRPAAAIRYVYAEVFIITAGSMADLLVYGP